MYLLHLWVAILFREMSDYFRFPRVLHLTNRTAIDEDIPLMESVEVRNIIIVLLKEVFSVGTARNGTNHPFFRELITLLIKKFHFFSPRLQDPKRPPWFYLKAAW